MSNTEVTIYRADYRKSLLEYGVKPGWFCKHAGCSIWFEIIQVFDNAVLCVSRSPEQQTTYVGHYDGWGSIWHLADGRPTEGHIICADRKKNFFDKFFPEKHNIQYAI